MWMGATPIFALVALLYAYMYCKEILQKQVNGETPKEAAFMRLALSVPYFVPAIDAIIEKLDGKPEPELPIFTPADELPRPIALSTLPPLKLQTRKMLFKNSVNTATASPHFEDDFFFGDIPADDI